MGFRLCIGAALALALCAASVSAQPASRQTRKAQAQIEEGEFEAAVRTIDSALMDPTLSEDDQVELYRLLGLAHLYLGDEERARTAYERLLQARPDYEIPRSAPPKIRDLYARIKEDIRRRRLRPVTLEVEPPGQATANQPLNVEAEIENLGAGVRAKLYFRRAGNQSYSSVEFARAVKDRPRFRATIPAYELPAEGRDYQLEVYLEVADAAQRRLAGRGDPLNPLRVRILGAPDAAPTAAAPKPWFHNPWLWVGAGVVVAGAATGAVLLATAGGPTGNLPIVIRVDP